MSNTSSPPHAIRGPLRYDIYTSSPQIEAGREFSVFVKISNPYDVPATIRAVTTLIPAKFEDMKARAVDKERMELTRHLQERQNNHVSDASRHNIRRQKLLEIFDETLRLLPFGSIFVGGIKVAQYVTASTDRASELLDVELAIIKDKIERLANIPEGEERLIIEQLIKRLDAINNARQSSALLQPGNSMVQAFTLRTTQTILFAPSSYNLIIQSEYKIDGSINRDSLSYKLDVRAPISALVSGSAIGSIIGYLVKDIYEQRSLVTLLQHPEFTSLLPWMLSLIGAVLLGTLTVIAFARKKETQPLISVEDFWGGMFVGFLAGYLGNSVLTNIIPNISPLHPAPGSISN